MFSRNDLDDYSFIAPILLALIITLGLAGLIGVVAAAVACSWQVVLSPQTIKAKLSPFSISKI
jgi:hypothetical protein